MNSKYLILLLIIFSFALAKESKAAPINIIPPTEQAEILDEAKINDVINSQIKKDYIQSAVVDNLPNELMGEITADEINFSQETKFYEAIGNAEVYLPDREARLFADKITYDTEKN